MSEPEDRGEPEPADAREVEGGLRFAHAMMMQTKSDLVELSATVYALFEELLSRGYLDVPSVDRRRGKVKERELERQQRQAHVELDTTRDKYALTVLPEIDCASLIPLCKGRCCKLQVALSFQDLDERVAQWDYEKPYRMRKAPSGYCVHCDQTTRSCQIYQHRPAVCRTYDCRHDKRIWLDFERRIPAPDDDLYGPGSSPK
jgi:Fe-S-cluster containining protein